MTLVNKKSNPARHYTILHAVNMGEVFRGEETKSGNYIFINRTGQDTGEWVTCEKTPENYMMLMAASKKLSDIRATASAELEVYNKNKRSRAPRV